MVYQLVTSTSQTRGVSETRIRPFSITVVKFSGLSNLRKKMTRVLLVFRKGTELAQAVSSENLVVADITHVCEGEVTW